MKKVLLVHQDQIQHYRVPVYNYLWTYLQKHGFELLVASEDIQKGCAFNCIFPLYKISLKLNRLVELINNEKPGVVVLFVNLNNKYLFPLMFFLKFKKIKIIYWGHGIDLQDAQSLFKRGLNSIQHQFSDALILYADHLKSYINPSLYKKCFIANNTLNLTDVEIPPFDKKQLLISHNITTDKNIICTGRIQKRKRIEDLLLAFSKIQLKECGLIIVGPVDDELKPTTEENRKNVHFLGPVYGIKTLQLLRSSDVYCIPGAIGLSIVDAQYCGLPVVTENVTHGPEIMYLKDGINGFLVPKGNIDMLAGKLRLLLQDDNLRKQFSDAAKEENATNGHIDRMCEGFVKCLKYIEQSESHSYKGIM